MLACTDIRDGFVTAQSANAPKSMSLTSVAFQHKDILRLRAHCNTSSWLNNAVTAVHLTLHVGPVQARAETTNEGCL